MKTRATAAVWAERVKAWREGGQTAPAFAEGKGFSDSLLRWWAGELARRSGQIQKPRVKTVRVVRRPETSPPLTLLIGAARIEVRAGFDRALIREIVEALGGTR